MAFIRMNASADYSLSPLKKLILLNAFGFPRVGLKALYLFDEIATLGVPFAGPFLDASGNGNHATIFPGRAGPIKRTYGIEITDQHGLILQTPVPMPDKHTIVAAMRSTMNTASVDGYPTLFGDAGMGIPGDKTLAHSTTSGPSGGRVIPTMELAGSADRYGLYSSLNVFAGAGRLNLDQDAYGKASDRQVWAFSFDNDIGKTVFATRSGGSIGGTYPALAGAVTGDDINIVLGIWPNGASRPATGEIRCFAVYDDYLSDEARRNAIDAAAAFAGANGFPILGA